MTEASSLGLPGGISRPSSCRSALMIGLSSGFPTTSAGPESPPCSSASRESSLSPPFTFEAVDEWQAKQDASSTGRIFCAKSRSASGEVSESTGSPPLASHPRSDTSRQHARLSQPARPRSNMGMSLANGGNPLIRVGQVEEAPLERQVDSTSRSIGNRFNKLDPLPNPPKQAKGWARMALIEAHSVVKEQRGSPDQRLRERA